MRDFLIWTLVAPAVFGAIIWLGVVAKLLIKGPTGDAPARSPRGGSQNDDASQPR